MKASSSVSKKFRYLSGSLLLSAALVGCSNINQDPLSGQPESIRQGQVPDQKTRPDIPKPISEEALRIDVPDFASFKEGTEGELKIGGRVLLPIEGRDAVLGQDYKVEVDNLADFPGATFDAASGVFKWTPPRKFAEAEYTRNMQMELSLTTITGTVMSRIRTVAVFVSRTELDPEIIKVDDLMSPATRESEKRTFTVTVSDPDATDAVNARPRIFAIGNGPGRLSLAHLVRVSETAGVPVQDPTDKKKWTFTMVLDTTDAELTKGEELLSFALVTVSRFGRSSAPYIVNALIRTGLREPQVSWSIDPVEMIQGENNSTQFSVYDPGAESKIRVDISACEKVFPGAQCSCTDQSRDSSQQLCTIKWKVPADFKAGEYEFDIGYTVSSRVAGDSQGKQGKFKRKLRVVAKPELKRGGQ